MLVDGRLYTVDEFLAECWTVNLSDVRKVVVHHTAEPTLEKWQKYGGWDYWSRVLKRYYESKGWTACPHVFVGDDGIGVLNPLDRPGRAVGGGYNERGLRHVEIVGNFNDDLPKGLLLHNALCAIAILLRAAGLTVGQGLTNHTEVVGKGVTDCPGKKLLAEWNWFKTLVGGQWTAYMRAEDQHNLC